MFGTSHIYTLDIINDISHLCLPPRTSPGLRLVEGLGSMATYFDPVAVQQLSLSLSSRHRRRHLPDGPQQVNVTCRLYTADSTYNRPFTAENNHSHVAVHGAWHK